MKIELKILRCIHYTLLETWGDCAFSWYRAKYTEIQNVEGEAWCILAFASVEKKTRISLKKSQTTQH